jgi:tol-pal system protein YbgF
MKKVVVGFIFSCLSVAVYARAPVVEYSVDSEQGDAQSFALPAAKSQQPINKPVANRNLNADQRLVRVEQQVDNINNQNLLQRVEELQQNVQNLTGKLESQTHQIDLLNQQLKSFYQDLNQRIDPAKRPIAVNTAANVGAVASINNTSSLPSKLPNDSSANALSSIVPATSANLSEALNNQSTAQASNNNNAGSDVAFLKEQQMYQTAIDLLPEKKHESEIKLREYLTKYPKGSYVANAHYWLGDINYIQKNFDAAEEEYKLVVNKYPKSRRVADALLKLAFVHQNQGHEKEAKEEFQKIVKRYPGTSAAQNAKEQLAAK